MADLPVIFSAPMVRALLDGRKTMTRRLAWQKPQVWMKVGNEPAEPILVQTLWQKVKPGDRLWVRETHNVQSAGYKDGTGQRIAYRATEPEWPYGWTPAIHMFRFASRLTLTVTATKIERLQDIGWNDAIAEGLLRGGPLPEVPGSYGMIYHDGVTDPIEGWTRDPTAAFRTLWEAIHGAESWDANPEAVALTFTVHKVNIDKMGMAP